MSFDPISLVSGGLQSLIGAGQSIFGGKQLKKDNAALQNQVNSFKPNQSILDYYDKALAKYDTNPYNSVSYNNATKMNNRTFASGLNSLQGYRQAGSGIAKLVQQNYDANAKAAANAEQMQNQNLAQLGTAAERKTAEDQKKFDMNYNLLAMKAGQSASKVNSGIANTFGGLSTIGAGYKPKDKNYYV